MSINLNDTHNLVNDNILNDFPKTGHQFSTKNKFQKFSKNKKDSIPGALA